MASTIYLRPIGRLSRPPGRVHTSPDRMLRLADRDDSIFSACELIQRHGDGWTDRRIMALDELRALLALGGSGSDRIQSALQRLALPRAAIAGLALDVPRIMGIVNVTPDSFSDGGSFVTAKAAIAHALQLADDGADILDIGGESTRPGADPVSLDEELRRVLPVIEGVVGRTHARISVDTRKAEVMRRAAAAGAHLINDVSALAHDAQSLRVAAETKLPVVLMHALADPQTMQQAPSYGNALLDIYDKLEARIDTCVRAGILRDRLIVDPGIGFGKTTTHNLELLAGLSLFHSLGTPILLGASRKSFIGTLTGAVDPAERLPGSIAAALSGIMQGAQIVRVHDVAATRQALTIWQAATSGIAQSVMGL